MGMLVMSNLTAHKKSLRCRAAEHLRDFFAEKKLLECGRRSKNPHRLKPIEGYQRDCGLTITVARVVVKLRKIFSQQWRMMGRCGLPGLRAGGAAYMLKRM